MSGRMLILVIFLCFSNVAYAEDAVKIDPVKADAVETDSETDTTLKDTQTTPKAISESQEADEVKDDVKEDVKAEDKPTLETNEAVLSTPLVPANESPAKEMPPENAEEAATIAPNNEQTEPEQAVIAEPSEQILEDDDEEEGVSGVSDDNGDNEDNDDESENPDENAKAESRARLLLFGGVTVPASNEQTGVTIGGVVAYDLWDLLGIEMFLSQTWSGLKFTNPNGGSLKILMVKPGLRYRFWNKGSFRVYGMAHGGFEQIQWNKNASGTTYNEGFCGDVGGGLEFRFFKIMLIDLFASYEIGVNTMPQDLSGKTDNHHGLFVGLGVGVSSKL